jgi:myosin heavy subunit
VVTTTCKSCGCQIASDSAFCTECGSALIPQDSEEQPIKEELEEPISQLAPPAPKARVEKSEPEATTRPSNPLINEDPKVRALREQLAEAEAEAEQRIAEAEAEAEVRNQATLRIEELKQTIIEKRQTIEQVLEEIETHQEDLAELERPDTTEQVEPLTTADHFPDAQLDKKRQNTERTKELKREAKYERYLAKTETKKKVKDGQVPEAQLLKKELEKIASELKGQNANEEIKPSKVEYSKMKLRVRTSRSLVELLELSLSDDPKIRLLVAQNSYTGPGAIRRLMSDPDGEVRQAAEQVSALTSMSRVELGRLCLSDDPNIRLLVAQNLHTGEGAIRKLMSDPDDEVRQAAERAVNTFAEQSAEKAKELN